MRWTEEIWGQGIQPLFGATATDLPVHLVCYNQSMEIDEVRHLGLPRIGGCICSDGAFEAHTAALFEPYADEPDNYGALTFTQEVMDRFVLDAHKEGLQIAVHCESERSIEQVLWAMEKALRAFPTERPSPPHRAPGTAYV
jgi:predicted amidohydrolase YtcJ